MTQQNKQRIRQRCVLQQAIGPGAIQLRHNTTPQQNFFSRSTRRLGGFGFSHLVGKLPQTPSDVITAVSPAAINYIENYTDLPINFVPNGIDFKTYKNTKSKRSSNTILFIGRLEKRKGARYLLKAFEQIKIVRPDMKLLIAGKGPLERSLKTYVSENNIQDVEFLGFIEDDEKVRLLQTCSVYTSPALYGESFGIVLTEAMACGIPTVAHNNDGYSSVLKETGRLSLVDCKDIQAYAERLLTMIEEEPVRKLWQDWAEVYVKQFDYEKIVDSYEKLYKEHIRK